MGELLDVPDDFPFGDWQFTVRHTRGVIDDVEDAVELVLGAVEANPISLHEPAVEGQIEILLEVHQVQRLGLHRNLAHRQPEDNHRHRDT